jgi:PncC family amidohydrolase
MSSRDLGTILRENGLKIAVAESCTGGLICDMMTDVPGSSDYFMAGLVTYSDRSKIEILGVDERSLLQHGAVSAEVAEQMAAGAMRLVGTDIGLSTTCIAGPGGATEGKPIGLVYIGLAFGELVLSEKMMFTGARQEIKRKAADHAIEMTIRLLEG